MFQKISDYIFTNQKFLSKVPFSLFLLAFFFPIILININYQMWLLYIAFYVSYWTIKAFMNYYFIMKSYFDLLSINKKDYKYFFYKLKEWPDLKHIVLLPVYNEPYDVIDDAVASIVKAEYPYKENIIVLLAVEERWWPAVKNATKVLKKYENKDIKIEMIVHPDWIPNEWKVKWANITYAVKEYIKWKELDEHLTYVSTIDTDTKVDKNFFLIANYTYLTTDYRDHAIYQYNPVYSNNRHKWTFFARLIAMWTTFRQLSESQNPEFYRNFAVYWQSLYCLKKSHYWSLDSIVEDWLQYWRSYFAFDSLFRIVNVPAVCHMDLVEEENFVKSVKAQYKQLRRWSWWASDVEYVIPEFYKNKKITLLEKFRKTLYLLLNHMFWASASFMFLFIGYYPGLSLSVSDSISTFAVPISISMLASVLFLTIFFPSLLSILIMRKYTSFRKRDYLINVLQWILIPFLKMTLFSIPAIESQFRLFTGKRLDNFEVTKKMSRK